MRHLQRARKREVPRATLQRVRRAKFPAQDLRACPIKEKRAKRFSPLDLKEQIRAVVVRDNNDSSSIAGLKRG